MKRREERVIHKTHNNLTQVMSDRQRGQVKGRHQQILNPGPQLLPRQTCCMSGPPQAAEVMEVGLRRTWGHS